MVKLEIWIGWVALGWDGDLVQLGWTGLEIELRWRFVELIWARMET